MTVGAQPVKAMSVKAMSVEPVLVNPVSVDAAAVRPDDLFDDAPQIDVGDLVAVDGDLNGDRFRLRFAAREVDGDVVYRFTGHLLGGMNGLPDGGFGGVHVDHNAALDPATDLVAHADNAGDGCAMGDIVGRRPVDACDHAAHLAGADIQGGDQSAARLCRTFGQGQMLRKLRCFCRRGRCVRAPWDGRVRSAGRVCAGRPR